LKIVDNVQCKRDDVLLASRRIARRNVVGAISAQTVVPANLDAAHHIFPKGVVNSARQSEQPSMLARSRWRVPKPVAGTGVLGAAVELQLLGGLIHQVKHG